MKIKFLTVAALAVALGSCSNNDAISNNDGSAQFFGTIEQSSDVAVTRVADGAFEAADSIGIFYKDQDRFSNMMYVSNEGKFVAKDDANKIYYQDTKEASFAAYYPYDANVTKESNLIEKTIEYATPLEEVDFLFAEGTGKKSSPKVDFTFKHKMAKVTINFKNGKDTKIQDLESFSLSKVYLTGTFNAETGESKCEGVTAEFGGDLTVNDQDVTSLTKSFIAFAGNINSDVTLKVTLGGQTYQAKINLAKEDESANFNLMQGYNHIINVTINKTEMVVGTTTIEPWINAEAVDVDAEMVEPEANDIV